MQALENEMRLNPSDAPYGYYAVLKSDAKPSDGSNICRVCDWRQFCDGYARCMPYEVVTKCGDIVGRDDGKSVVFKKIPSPA